MEVQNISFIKRFCDVFLRILCFMTFPSIIIAVRLCNIERHDDVGLLVKALVPFEPFDLLERSVGIPIPINAILWSELINYMEGYNATHGILALGIGMLLNHNDQFVANVRKVPLYEPGLRKFREPYESSIDFLHEITSYMEIGEQLTVDYGEDWFVLRNMTQMPIVDEIQSTTQSLIDCPSSFTHLTRDGRIVATIFILEGTVIEISRAILIPVTHAVLSSGPLEEMLWWYNTNDESINIAEPSDLFLNKYPTSPSEVLPYLNRVEHAMLLSGHGALYKALPCSTTTSNEVNLPNVEYAWFEETDDSVTCDNLMLMSFKALRDIPEDEEIIVANICHPEDGKGYRKQVKNPKVIACLESKR